MVAIMAHCYVFLLSVTDVLWLNGMSYWKTVWRSK